ncbi:NAD(P)/FAD-dependent oxidoreductase [Flavobacteriaceae bacterium M23B6Z8]
MEFSYWEIKEWLSNVDFTIVGSGITGLSCALALREKYPKAKMLILEKGLLPQGASTKNAGFACFGSVSELLDDLQHQSEENTLALVEKRWKGLALLRKNLGDKAIDYQHHSGFELFQNHQREVYEECLEKIEYLNRLLRPHFEKNVFSTVKNDFGFKKVFPLLIKNAFEGQLDTGKMMRALLQKAYQERILILNGISFESYSNDNTRVHIKTDHFSFIAKKLFIATNGYASQLGLDTVKPARAQVLITKPIEKLKIKGTFHMEEGYYYFRNIDNRILFGGGRNLDLKGETTTELAQTDQIQNQLESLLGTVILPDNMYEIEHRWSGIMGVGNHKNPILKTLGPHVFCGVRLGGMGVAIGSLTGRELAAFVN